MSAVDTPPLLKPKEAREALRCTSGHLDRLTEAGQLHPVTLPNGQRRYLEAEVKAVTEGRSGPGTVVLPPARVMRIGQVARFFGVTTRTIRVWEAKGCLTSTRSMSNAREYPAGEVHALGDALEELAAAERYVAR